MVRDGKGRFLNLDGSVPQSLSTVVRWAVVDRMMGRRRRTARRADLPYGPVDVERVAAPLSGGGARLTWLGHASWLVQIDGTSLLIDPVFSDALGPGMRRNMPVPIAARDLPSIAAQLVSHNHRDHLDMPTVAEVGAPVVAGLGTSRLFKSHASGCTELDWWEGVQIGAVRVTFVPAQHWSRRGLFDANRMLWGGFVIEGSRTRIYHAGDSAWFDGFSEIGRRFPGIKAALLPIGAYDPAWFMEQQHLSPEKAVRAFIELGAERFVAMHWGTFKLADEPLEEPPQRLSAEWERLGLPTECLLIPATGETVELG